MRSPTQPTSLPPVDRRVLSVFQWYSRRYLRKHFHAMAIHQRPLNEAQWSTDDNFVVYANHASWWDPLVALVLAKHFFGDVQFFAPIDAKALEKYRIFGKLGFFPVEQESLGGAKNFLQTAASILSHPRTSVWITPEGRFADVRDHSAELMPGLAHLVSHMQRKQKQSPGQQVMPKTWLIPVAIEYTYWEERFPEILVWFGNPVLIQDCPLVTKEQWSADLAERLRVTQQRLAVESIARNTAPFELLFTGSAGTSAIYDAWRWLMARLRGQRVELQHGEKFRGT